MRVTVPSVLVPESVDEDGRVVPEYLTADLDALPSDLRPYVLRYQPNPAGDHDVDIDGLGAEQGRVRSRLDAVAALAEKADATAQEVAQAARP